MKIKYFMLGMCIISSISWAKIIYGIDKIKEDSIFSGPVYIQMGSYTQEYSAQKKMREIRSQHFANVVIKPQDQQYKVLAGPFVSKDQLMQFYHSFQEETPNPPPQEHKVIRPVPVIKRLPTSQLSHPWYVMGNIGGQYNKLNPTATVNNGSGFPTPYNQDQYSGNTHDPAVLLGVGLGKRFELGNEWIQAASLGVHYQYFFANTISGQITQFSLPQFQNYNYQWPVSSNVIFAQGKLHFKDYKAFSPYFSLGLGGVIHQSDGYTEHAYSEITPRISPNFGNDGSSQFAYLLGVGVDYPIGNQMTLSAGYQFSGLGRAKSGSGEGTWSSEYLDFGNYQSNAFLFSATYWFDTNFNFGWIK